MESRNNYRSHNQEEQQQQLLAHQINTGIMQERENNINEICNDVEKIHEIFSDLNQMLEKQGDILDTIEAHMEKVDVTIEKGTEEISKARSYARSAGRMFMGLVGVVGTVALGVGLALGLK